MKPIINKYCLMKHLYTPNSNKPLISSTMGKIQDYVAKNISSADSLYVRQMETQITDIEFEPDESIIGFLLNYSRSLEVMSLLTNAQVCMLTKN